MKPSRLVVGLVAVSHVVNHTYLILLPPAFTVLGAEFGVSVVRLGLAVGVLMGTVTALQLPFGYLSDSYSHGFVLAVSLVTGAVGVALTAAAPSYEWLLAAQVVTGVGVAGHHPAHYPLLANAVSGEKRGRAYSVHGFAGAIGLAVPFAVVPLVLRAGGTWRQAFGLVALGGAVVALVVLFVLYRYVPLSTRRTRTERSRPSPFSLDGLPGRVLAGVRELAASRAIVLLTLLWFVNAVAAWGVKTYAPTLLAGQYGVEATEANLAGAAMLAVGAGLLLLGGWLTDRTGPIPVTLAGYASLVVLAFLLGTGTLPLAVAFACVLLLAATLDISRPARSTLTDLASARGDVGKNFALMTVGISAGGALAPPLFGLVIEVGGVGPAFYGVGAVAVLAFALTLAVR